MINKNINKLNKILARFDLHTDNYEYYDEAFTHSTYANEHNAKSNERIEFLGDGLLNCFTAEFIYDNFTDLPEGKMSKLRATYVCEDANFKYAKELGLDELLLLGHGEETQGGRKKVAVVADTFECFLGATYKTFNVDAVIRILEEIVFPLIKEHKVTPFVDYKTKLQEVIQDDTKQTVTYIVIKEEGKPNDKTFTMAAVMGDIEYGRGVGKSKKEASQAAAKAALDKMVIK